MKGKGIQITNKAFREGYERTFRKDPDEGRFWDVLHLFNGTRDEIEQAIDSYSSLVSCLKDVEAEYDKRERSNFSAAAQWWFIRDLVLARMNKHFDLCFRHVNSYTKEELKEITDQLGADKKTREYFTNADFCVDDPDAIVDSSGYCSVHESYHCKCYRPSKKRPLMESWVLDINHLEGLD